MAFSATTTTALAGGDGVNAPDGDGLEVGDEGLGAGEDVPAPDTPGGGAAGGGKGDGMVLEEEPPRVMGATQRNVKPSEVKFCPLMATSNGSTDADCAGAAHDSVTGSPLSAADTV